MVDLLFLLIGVCICVIGFIWVYITHKPFQTPYIAQPSLLTKNELRFYSTLSRSIDWEEHTIMLKVRMWDVVDVAPHIKQKFSYQTKIQAKHLDFVICDNDTFQPLLVVELDDRSHFSEDAKKRDQEKDEALRFAGIPIVRFMTGKDDKFDHVQKQISFVLYKK